VASGEIEELVLLTVRIKDEARIFVSLRNSRQAVTFLRCASG